MRPGILTGTPQPNARHLQGDPRGFKLSRYSALSIPNATETLMTWQYHENEIESWAEGIDVATVFGTRVVGELRVPPGVSLLLVNIVTEFTNTGVLNGIRSLRLKRRPHYGATYEEIIRAEALGKYVSGQCVTFGAVPVTPGDVLSVWCYQNDGGARDMGTSQWSGRAIA